ncbi:MAG: sulfite exporter TauE/SafE family protein [Polyangiaceae bacterium]|nr:sulfite exporter TauE/SafE family protein [Polyangiaceae bacterium]
MLDPELLWPALAVAGLVSGFVNVAAGGGSTLVLPLLVLFGLPADVANGTNRLNVLTQSLTGFTTFYRAGRVETKGVLPLVGASAAGAVVGAALASRVPEPVLRWVLLLTMLAVAVAMIALPALVPGAGVERPLRLRESPFGTLGVFAAALYGGFVQAGVGLVLVAVLGGLLRYDLVRANALKMLCTFVYGSVALAVFAWTGQVAWGPAAVLAVTSALGAWLGVRFTLRIPAAWLRWFVLVGVVVVVVAALAASGRG